MNSLSNQVSLHSASPPGPAAETGEPEPVDTGVDPALKLDGLEMGGVRWHWGWAVQHRDCVADVGEKLG